MANRKVTVMNGFVLHEGKLHKVGDELTLSDAQIDRLGDQVEASGKTAATNTRKAAEVNADAANAEPEADKENE